MRTVVCLSVCLSACLSACLPVCLSVCLSACLSACLPACLSACAVIEPSALPQPQAWLATTWKALGAQSRQEGAEEGAEGGAVAGEGAMDPMAAGGIRQRLSRSAPRRSYACSARRTCLLSPLTSQKVPQQPTCSPGGPTYPPLLLGSNPIRPISSTPSWMLIKGSSAPIHASAGGELDREVLTSIKPNLLNLSMKRQRDIKVARGVLLAMLREGVANEHSYVSFFQACAASGAPHESVDLWRSLPR